MKTKYLPVSIFTINLLLLTLFTAGHFRPNTAQAQSLSLAPVQVQTISFNLSQLNSPRVWHVATDGSDVNRGGSATRPFATIQHAINNAINGDTVLIHPGTYPENIKFEGKNIVVGSLFVTTDDKRYITQTVIDAHRAGRAVTFEDGEDSSAVLSGLTLTNGYVTETGGAGSGGGLACFNANPTLTHLIVSGNEATAEGGGLFFDHCSSKLEDTLIANNIALAGGGIRYSYGSPSLENVIITHNTAQGDGAGIHFYHTDASIKNALIASNVGGSKGGGLMFDGSSPALTNVTIAGNTTSGHGGGLNISYASSPTLINSIVWGNAPEQIYFDPDWPGEAVTIQNSDVQGGATGIVTNGQGPVNWGAGNLDLDPRFFNESNDNYHLWGNSPGIGAGIPPNTPVTDLDGNPRPNPADSNPDLGAYEHPLATPIIIWHVAVIGSDVTGDGSAMKPFATIQHGIDVASAGDTVLVHPGRYQENIIFKGKNITLGSLFAVTGDKSYIAQTVIDGNRAGRVVTFEDNEDASAVLSGFTLTNGYIQGGNGGGVACFNANPTLVNLIVSRNEATGEGGGLYFDHCSSKLQDSSITDNTAFAGGGMRCSYGSPNLENVIIAHNTTRGDGAGLHLYHTDATIKNALIANNAGGAKGGGLMFDKSSPTLMNVTIVGNTTTGHGGGLNVSYASNPFLVYSIVWANSPEQIYFDTDWPEEAVTIQYTDLQGGAAGIVTNGQGPVNWGAGNLDLEPRFVGSGDYHLAPTSPGIGAGTPDNAPTGDLDGNIRPNPVGSNPDLGAYEHPLGAPQPLSTLQGHIYLDWRSRGHYTATQVVLIGTQATYTATTDPNGDFTLADLYPGPYTLQTSHSLFVRARRTVTVSPTSTQTLSEVGLWAGDIDQNQKVNLYDWYLLAAAIYPVSNPLFDIDDDGLTNLKDLAIMTLNLGRPNMTGTNPPPRPGLASLDLEQPIMIAQSEGQLRLVPAGDHEMILRLEEVSKPVYAVGTRLALPTGATVTEVEARSAFANGFLEWHQVGSTFYLVTAPAEEKAITQNTDVVIIRGTNFAAGETEVAAENNITTGPTHEFFLPLIIK